jgi:hypothetical protein
MSPAVLLLSLWACTCNSTTKPAAGPAPTLDVPAVDRTQARGATCYSGDDGVRLQLVVSARPDATALLTRPGGPPIPLEGKRDGRNLILEGAPDGPMLVELLGRKVAVTPAGKPRVLMQATGCPGAPEP